MFRVCVPRLSPVSVRLFSKIQRKNPRRAGLLLEPLESRTLLSGAPAIVTHSTAAAPLHKNIAAPRTKTAIDSGTITFSDSVSLNNDTAVTILPGAVLNYSLTITNTGTRAASGRLPILLQASGSSDGSNPATIGYARVYVALRAGASKTFNLKFTVPGTLAVGSYFLVTTVDPNNTFGDETDNTAVADSTFTIGGSTSFAPKMTVNVGGYDPYSVVLADVNGDGIPDMITVNYTHSSDSVSVLLGNGDGTFGAPQTYAVGTGPIGLAVRDVNGDGTPDIVTANARSNNVSVLLNNGDGTFGTQTTYATGTEPQSVALADLNGDGFDDIIATNYHDGTVSVLLNNGDGTFGAATNYAAGPGAFGLAVGDFTGDGNIDIATSNVLGDDVSVLLGNGDGTFGPETTYAVGNNPRSIAAGVLTSSGHVDLVATDTGTVGAPGDSVSVLLGNGDGTFATAVNYATGRGPVSVKLADMNGDGALDIITSDYDANTVSTLLGNGDGTFQPPQSYAVGVHPSGIAIGDLDGDGAPDIVATNERGDQNVSILLARSPAITPTVTVVPLSLVSTIKTTKTVRMTLTDTGAAVAQGPVTIDLYASTDQALDDSDTLVTTQTRNVNLGVGDSVSFAVPLGTIPSLDTGDYYIIANATGIPDDISTSAASNDTVSVITPDVVHAHAATASVSSGVFNSASIIATPFNPQTFALPSENKILAAM